MEPRKVKEWNTKNLGQRLSVDLMAASSAGILVAPIITVIDRFVLCSIRTFPSVGLPLPYSTWNTLCGVNFPEVPLIF